MFNQIAYPIGLDAGIRINRWVFVGAYFSFAPTVVSSGFYSAWAPCDSSCWARVYHFGLEVQFHPVRSPPGAALALDPWVGLGGGWEVQQQQYTAPMGSVTAALQGPEFFIGQVGLAVTFDRMSLGPYAGASYGSYVIEGGASLNSAESHWWLEVGLRFTVTP
ncbi:MAG: hypothetical protein ACLQDQ_15335 [Myxococcaceae bacterium]